MRLIHFIKWKYNDIKLDREIVRTLKALQDEANKPFHERCGTILITDDKVYEEAYCKPCNEWVSLF